MSMKKIAETICHGYFENDKIKVLRTKKINSDLFAAKIDNDNDVHWILICLADENKDDTQVETRNGLFWEMMSDWIEEEEINN